MDEHTREQLHHVLRYLLESEAKGYHREPPEDRESWAYDSARHLMATFGFDDLVAEDEELATNANVLHCSGYLVN